MSDVRVLQQLDKLVEKHDKLDERLHSIDKQLNKYNSELEFHVARTNELQDLVVPVHEWMLKWQGVGQIIVWASVVATILGGLAWIWSR
jgi:hypothetical protein